jgi:hypothetical protein
MNATLTDDRRRLVMPPELPARSPVTVQQIDADTWIVKRARPVKSLMVVLLPDVKKLSDDKEWEAIEQRMAEHHYKKLPPFEA